VEARDEKLEGSVVFDRDTALHGMVVGNLTVGRGVRADIHGVVTGTLVVRPGAIVDVHGKVDGALLNEGGQVRVFGIVESITDMGNTKTWVDPSAIVHSGRA
jgi:cytoskeletal protein CcmA (bactofilin family)